MNASVVYMDLLNVSMAQLGKHWVYDCVFTHKLSAIIIHEEPFRDFHPVTVLDTSSTSSK